MKRGQQYRRFETARSVNFVVCQNCGLHGCIVLDGEEQKEVVTREEALLQMIDLLATRRITFQQSRGLMSKIVAAETIPANRDAAEPLIAAVFESLVAEFLAQRQEPSLYDIMFGDALFSGQDERFAAVRDLTPPRVESWVRNPKSHGRRNRDNGSRGHGFVP